jgi:protein-L-isoaspartate(D-aspartate) O-methyltransferase
MPELKDAREHMVEAQIARRGIRAESVLTAMREVPREEFVALGMEEFAYEDGPLPIGEGQTISQPYIVALMVEAAQIMPADRVLEVGTGSGYAAAVMSRLARRVFTIERHPTLAEAARRRFAQLGYDNIEVRVGDGTRGMPDEAPFQAILVAASGPEVPEALKSQLAVGGRLIIPVGQQHWRQNLYRVTQVSETEYREEDLGAVSFVPLIGAEGWTGDVPDTDTYPFAL